MLHDRRHRSSAELKRLRAELSRGSIQSYHEILVRFSIQGVMRLLQAWNWPLILTDISGIGLLVFAGVQVYLMHAAERARRKERLEDESEREQVAYGALWAEYARMWRIAGEWESHDLLSDAFIEQFHPDEILPRDWGRSTLLLGELGLLSAHLGGFACAAATHAESDGNAIVATVDRLRKQHGVLDVSTLARADPVTFRALRETEKLARSFARDAERTFRDALDNSRPGSAKSEFGTMRSAVSGYGETLKKALDSGASIETIGTPPSPTP